MDIYSFKSFVFQVNLVDGFTMVDKRGQIIADIFSSGHKKILQDIDTIKISDNVGEYQLSPLSFLLRLDVDKLGKLIKNSVSDEKPDIVPFVNSSLEEFITKTKSICSMLGVKKISRFACRYIVYYNASTSKDLPHLRSIFSTDTNLLEKSFLTLGRNARMEGLAFSASYKKFVELLELDIDRYIIDDHYDVDDIRHKYDVILKQFRQHIFNPKSMVSNLI